MTSSPQLACRRPRRRHARLVAVAALAAAAFVVSPAVAAADLEFPDPAGSGAKVTIVGVTSTEFYPGQRLELRGTGFFPANTSPSAARPAIAIRPYDLDLGPAWSFGGADALPNFFTGEAQLWFSAAPDTGQWSGWIETPSTMTRQGPLTGNTAGQHWLRVLSGAFATDSGAPETGNRTVPITYTIPFTVRERLTLGLTGPGAAGNFQTGTYFRPGAQITPQAVGFEPDAEVTATLDGSPLGAPITADASGNLPAEARVTLPSDVTPGSHTLALTAGSDVLSTTITVTPPPTATLVTPAVRPGGRFAFEAKNFIGVAGRGQKVAVVIDEQVMGCVTAGSDGSLSGTALVPAGSTGDVTVGFAAGTSCGGPGSPVNDLPGARVTAPLSVVAGAPALDAPASVVAGESLSLTGTGFAGGATASASLGGADVSSALTTDGSGQLSGTVAVPGDTAAGEHVLLVRAGTTTAVALVTVTAPSVSPPPGHDPPEIPSPGTPPGSPPAVTPKPPATTRTAAPALRRIALRGNRLTLTLTGKKATNARITVRTSRKVRVAPRRKELVTIASGRASRVGAVRLTLTRDGRTLMRRVRSVKVVVRISAPGRKTTTRTVTLRRAK